MSVNRLVQLSFNLSASLFHSQTHYSTLKLNTCTTFPTARTHRHTKTCSRSVSMLRSSFIQLLLLLRCRLSFQPVFSLMWTNLKIMFCSSSALKLKPPITERFSVEFARLDRTAASETVSAVRSVTQSVCVWDSPQRWKIRHHFLYYWYKFCKLNSS